MCHKLCLLMLTGKLPVSSASSVSLARSVRGVIVASKEYLERNILDYDLDHRKGNWCISVNCLLAENIPIQEYINQSCMFIEINITLI